MLNHYRGFLEFLQSQGLNHWAETLKQQLPAGLSEQRYGDLRDWRDALEELPAVKPRSFDLGTGVTIGKAHELTEAARTRIEDCFRRLIPWRKGPFSIFGVNIDAEWRSDWKWQRLLPHLPPLAGQVLDVGCGNGYHCLRMLGAGADRVTGIDPSPRFVVQFLMLKHFLGELPVDVLPITMEQLPPNLARFDTTFSMGVLYHRRSPMDHLRELKATLKPGGQLVLETLIIAGKEGQVLVPEGRYGSMRNVWFIPSAATLISWLRKCGFARPTLVDSNQTATAEQRSTEWMSFQSLANFLDPGDPNQTIEGHPAPLRGIFTATVE